MSAMSAYVIGSTPAEPCGAEATACVPSPSGSPGRNGARCSRTATGPTPGPPPPCGIANVLCRLRWLTSAPNAPGRASPTSALRLAPSTYTCPPAACTVSQIDVIVSSKTPCVEGYVTMIAASLSAFAAIFAWRSSRSTEPSAAAFTTTTDSPASAAEAAFVPCAEDGMRQTVRWVSPRDSWYPVSYTHLRAHETGRNLVCRLL